MNSEPNERQIRRAIGRADAGKTLNPAESAALLAARGQDLRALMATAARIRDQGLLAADRGGIITYSPKVFIPVTRLCRDRCSYCTFATDPATLRREGHGLFLSRDEVLQIARAGAAAGCTEALFTLGDTPETRWPAAQEWLESQGFSDTHAYLRASAIAVLEETGLLPHLNPGVMTWRQMQILRPVAPSMGMMLETTSRRLFEQKGEVHYGSPDKDPEVRLRVLADAGRSSIPFTTGLLLGIGETDAELIESILAIRESAREFGHIQEVLIQNFRAKPGTAAAKRPDLAHEAYLAAIATTRVLLGPKLRLQVPPNLSDPTELADLIGAGVDDLGGISPVTPDHVNPERPWPQIADVRATLESLQFDLAARLTVHPEYVQDADRWIDPRLHPHVTALARVDGLARMPAEPQGRSWQAPDPGYKSFAARNGGGRVDLGETIDLVGRRTSARADIASVFGDWDVIASHVAPAQTGLGPKLEPEERKGLALAESDPAALAREEHFSAAAALMRAEGDVLATLNQIADGLRRDAVGDDITYVVNRNLNFTNVCYTGCRFCAFAQRAEDADAFTLSLAEVGDRVDEAAEAGATEICMQGGIHPDLPGTAYFDLAAAVKARRPSIHLHAFSPMEVVNGASKANMSIKDWLIAAKAAGLDSIPGTAAEILDDEVRWILTKGKLPTQSWIDVVTTAHEVGLPSTSTMMFGHVDQPEHWVRHIALIRSLQERSGGFSEFVPLPFVHQQSPIYLAGVARPGPTARDNVAVHAMARIMLSGAIQNIQCSWVKLGPLGCAQMLQGGANDLGGTLMEETISRMAGSDHGSALTVPELVEIARGIDRPARQRTTSYGAVAQPGPVAS
ncbi:bifunctional FO biosynthesis protein CofGH [Candidatus Nanopelagicales bacterium]|nr:bifunctional FO biosynthesis protein CofGH [Candidatus Nanopelagicales bacterium]